MVSISSLITYDTYEFWLMDSRLLDQTKANQTWECSVWSLALNQWLMIYAWFMHHKLWLVDFTIFDHTKPNQNLQECSIFTIISISCLMIHDTSLVSWLMDSRLLDQIKTNQIWQDWIKHWSMWGRVFSIVSSSCQITHDSWLMTRLLYQTK